MSKYSESSMSVLLIFKMQVVKGALFLKTNFLSYALLFGSVIVIVYLTTIYTSLSPHRFDLNIDVLNLICLLDLNISLALLD